MENSEQKSSGKSSNQKDDKGKLSLSFSMNKNGVFGWSCVGNDQTKHEPS